MPGIRKYLEFRPKFSGARLRRKSERTVRFHRSRLLKNQTTRFHFFRSPKARHLDQGNSRRKSTFGPGRRAHSARWAAAPPGQRCVRGRRASGAVASVRCACGAWTTSKRAARDHKRARARPAPARQALAVARASCERRASAQRRGADVKSDQARRAGSRRAGARRRKRERSRRLLTRAPRVHRTEERDAHAHACVHAHDSADDAASTRQQAWPLFAPAALVRRHPRSRRSNASAIPGTRHAKSQNGPAGHPCTRTRVWRAARSIARDHATPCALLCACCAPSPATPGCIGQKKGKETGAERERGSEGERERGREGERERGREGERARLTPSCIGQIKRKQSEEREREKRGEV